MFAMHINWSDELAHFAIKFGMGLLITATGQMSQYTTTTSCMPHHHARYRYKDIHVCTDLICTSK